MSWKNKLHPQVSNAEIEIFAALSAAGLTRGMVTQERVVLTSTAPDFLWREKKKALYLDGVQVHRRHSEWDEEVTRLLELKGWEVLRIPYTAPLTAEVKADMLRKIKEFVGDTEV